MMPCSRSFVVRGTVGFGRFSRPRLIGYFVRFWLSSICSWDGKHRGKMNCRKGPGGGCRPSGRVPPLGGRMIFQPMEFEKPR